MSVKLGAKLPEERHNGLSDPSIVNDFLAQPRNAVLVVAIVANRKTETDNESGDVTPVLKIHHIEVADEDMRGMLAEALHKLHERRTGELMLPFEPGQDIPVAGEEDE